MYFNSEGFGGVEAIMKPNSFHNRLTISKKAVDILMKRSKYYGFVVVKDMGIEFDDKEIYLELSKRKDRTSIMLRHKPDKMVFTEEETILLQVKGSDEVEYDYFFVEIDSYMGAMEWNKTYRHTAFAFIINLIEEIKFIWADEVVFDTIFIPKRFDWKDQWNRLKELFPNKTLKIVPRGGGSGTPYIRVKKRETYNFLDLNNRDVVN